jgi:hypothetical protein
VSIEDSCIVSKKPLSFRLLTMPNGAKDDDIREVMAEESRRGKRPINAEARKLQRERQETMRRILAFTKETDVIAAIDLLGRGDDPDELEKILKLWRALSSSRRK